MRVSGRDEAPDERTTLLHRQSMTESSTIELLTTTKTTAAAITISSSLIVELKKTAGRKMEWNRIVTIVSTSSGIPARLLAVWLASEQER